MLRLIQSVIMLSTILFARLGFADGQEPDAEILAHIQRARVRQRLGDYWTALQEWRSAYDAPTKFHENPDLLLEIARLQERLGLEQEATLSYQQYLKDKQKTTGAQLAEAESALRRMGEPTLSSSAKSSKQGILWARLSMDGQELWVQNSARQDERPIRLARAGRFLVRRRHMVYVAHAASFTIVNLENREQEEKELSGLTGVCSAALEGNTLSFEDMTGSLATFDITDPEDVDWVRSVSLRQGAQARSSFPGGSLAALIGGIPLLGGGLALIIMGGLIGSNSNFARDYSVNQRLSATGPLVIGLGLGLLSTGAEGIRVYHERQSFIPQADLEDYFSGAKIRMITGGVITVVSAALSVTGGVLAFASTQSMTPTGMILNQPDKSVTSTGGVLLAIGDLLMPIGTVIFGVGVGRYFGYKDIVRVPSLGRNTVSSFAPSVTLAPLIFPQGVGMALCGRF